MFYPSSETSISIGNFDGVHLGHRELIRRTVGHARRLGLLSVVLIFSPHPIRFFRPGFCFSELTTVFEKAARMEELGIDVFVVESFDREIADMIPEGFARTVLRKRLRARVLTVGRDFTFGSHRTGSPEMLEELGRELGFEVDIVPPFEHGGAVVSSSRIRELLFAGKAREAEELLCRPFEVRGSVEQGAGRGRQLGFPTANVKYSQELLLLPGVYVADVLVDDVSFRGVANIGSNPTFGGNSIGIEAHLFDFQGSLYGKDVAVRFRERIRDEQKFQDADELVLQMHNDVECARRMNLPVWEEPS